MRLTRKQAILAVIAAVPHVGKAEQLDPRKIHLQDIGRGPTNIQIYIADNDPSATGSNFEFVFHFRGREKRFTAQELWDAL